MDAADNALVDYYRASAPLFERVYQKPERQRDLREIERVVSTEFAGRRVLELACGTGYWTRLIAASARSVTGVDAAPEMLAQARARLSAPDSRLVQGDAHDLPADLGVFDGAFAGFFLSHVPKARLRPFIAHLNGRLAPGARVLFVDNRFVEGSSSPIDRADAAGDTYQERRLADGTSHWVLKNVLTETELNSWVAGLGSEVRYCGFQYYWSLHYIVP